MEPFLTLGQFRYDRFVASSALYMEQNVCIQGSEPVIIALSNALQSKWLSKWRESADCEYIIEYIFPKVSKI